MGGGGGEGRESIYMYVKVYRCLQGESERTIYRCCKHIVSIHNYYIQT